MEKRLKEGYFYIDMNSLCKKSESVYVYLGNNKIKSLTTGYIFELDETHKTRATVKIKDFKRENGERIEIEKTVMYPTNLYSFQEVEMTMNHFFLEELGFGEKRGFILLGDRQVAVFRTHFDTPYLIDNKVQYLSENVGYKLFDFTDDNVNNFTFMQSELYQKVKLSDEDRKIYNNRISPSIYTINELFVQLKSKNIDFPQEEKEKIVLKGIID